MKTESVAERKTGNIFLIMFMIFTGFFFALSIFQFVEVGELEGWFWVTRVALIVFGGLFLAFSIACYRNFVTNTTVSNDINMTDLDKQYR